MKKKILLLAFAVLFSTVNGFAESDRYTWGYWALERGDFDDALYHFKTGADANYSDCMGALANMYAAGIGTAKNPTKAYYYLKGADFATDRYSQEFWILFHTGIDLATVVGVKDYGFTVYYEYMSSGFSKIPKYQQFLDSGKYNCTSFGKSPNMAEATKLLKQLYQEGSHIDGYLDCYSTTSSEERRAFEKNLFNRFFSYAKKMNDKELLGILGKANATAAEYADSTNYAKTAKDMASLGSFIEDACNTEWESMAKREYVEISANQIFKNGQYNQELDQEATKTIEGWDRWGNVSINDYKAKKAEGFYSLFLSHIRANDWEKAKQLPIEDFDLARDILGIQNSYEVVKDKIQVGTITKIEMSDFMTTVQKWNKKGYDKEYGFDRAAYSKQIINKTQEACDSMVLAKSENWDSNTSIEKMQVLISMASNVGVKAKVGDKYDQIAIERAVTWNANTEIAEMEQLLPHVSSFSSKVKVNKEYNRVALEKVATWTIDTEISDMDAVVAMNLDENHKNQVLDAYQKNALARMQAAGKRKKDLEMVKTAIESVNAMQHVNETTRMKANDMYKKVEAKQYSFFNIGLDGSIGVTGGMNTSVPAGGASIILGRTSQRLNLYIGGQYAVEFGTLDVETDRTEDMNARPLDIPNTGARIKKIEVPAELRYNFAKGMMNCGYIGLGAIYNHVLGGKLFIDDGLKVESTTFTDGLVPYYWSARASFGGRLGDCLELGMYVNYNLSSPFNSNATTDNLSGFEGTYLETQMEKSKFTTGLRLGLYF